MSLLPFPTALDADVDFVTPGPVGTAGRLASSTVIFGKELEPGDDVDAILVAPADSGRIVVPSRALLVPGVRDGIRVPATARIAARRRGGDLTPGPVTPLAAARRSSIDAGARSGILAPRDRPALRPSRTAIESPSPDDDFEGDSE